MSSCRPGRFPLCVQMKHGILVDAIMNKTTRYLGYVVLCTTLFVVGKGTIAQTPTPVTACGSYSGSLILMQDVSTSNGNCISLDSNAVFDGNGHTITVSGGGFAIWIYNRSNVSVTDVTSNAGIYIGCDSGVNANTVSVTYSTIESVRAFHVDDVTVDHSTMSFANFVAEEYDPILRTVFTHNTVTGDVETLLDFMGFNSHPCPETDFVVADNTFTNTYQCGGSGEPTCDEPKVLFMRCGSGNTVSRNIIRSTGQAMPGRFRDEFDGSTVSDNTFWGSDAIDGAFGVVNMTSGAVDEHYPQNNLFTRNVIRADADTALYNQGEGTGNTFSYNLIWATSSGYAANVADATVTGTNTYDHNTFYNGGTGLAVNFSYRASTVDTVTNNIFSVSGSAVYTFDGWTAVQYAGNRNLFHNRTGSVSFGSNGASLAAWKSNVSPDDVNSIESNPLLVDPANGNFALQSSSPARGAGTDGSDIGAYSYSSISCTESWTCGDWSACSSSTQTRTCTDANLCGTTAHRPAVSQSCDSTPPASITDLRAR